MSAWAYRCHSPNEGDVDLFVSAMDVEQLAPDVEIVRVKVGSDWKCRLLDRSKKVTVETQLLHHLIASDEADCPQCAELLAAKMEPPVDVSLSSEKAGATEDEGRLSPSSPIQPRGHNVTVQAAAISLQGNQFVVVLVPMPLVASPGEADMAISDLQPYFDGATIVLMAQKEDDSPSYYGDRQLVDLMANVPIDKMPWQSYPVG